MNHRSELLNMVYAVTGDAPPHHLYYLPDYMSAAELRQAWEGVGLRWNSLVADEMNNIADGSGRQYFLSNEAYMHQHRQEWNVCVPHTEHRGVFVYGRETMEQYFDNILNRHKDPDMQWYGPIYRDLGYACPVEQARFYQSDAWRRCAATVRYLYNYRCSCCGVRGSGLHVHHERPIQSVFSHRCYTNFADSSMRLLCEDCHKEIHRHLARIHHEFMPVSEEDAKESRQELRKFWSEYHKRGLCEYCNYFEHDITVETQ